LKIIAYKNNHKLNKNLVSRKEIFAFKKPTLPEQIIRTGQRVKKIA
jgi:hypothetical protein